MCVAGDNDRSPLFVISRSPAGLEYAIWARPRGTVLGTSQRWAVPGGAPRLLLMVMWKLLWHSQFLLTVVEAEQRHPWGHLWKESWPGPSENWVRDRVGELATAIQDGLWTPGAGPAPASKVRVMDARGAEDEQAAWEHEHPWPPRAEDKPNPAPAGPDPASAAE